MSQSGKPQKPVRPEGPPGRPPGRPPGPSLFALLPPYRPLIVTLVVMTILGNGLNLLIPRLIANAIDSYSRQQLVMSTLLEKFFAVAFGILVFTYLQAIVQTIASER